LNDTIPQSRSTFVLSLYYQNVGGMNSKINSFFNSASTSDFDSIAISETWLSDCVYSISAIRTIVPSLDVVCCKVMLNSLTHIYVFVLYFPPFLTISDFLTALECLELMISSLSSKVLLVGNFNAPGFGCVDGCVSDSRCSAVTNFLNILNLSQHNVVYNDLGRLLDLLIADFNCEVHHDFLPMLIESRHHPALFCSCTIEFAKSFTARQIPDVVAYNFRKADFVGLYGELMDVDWSFVSACDDVNVMCERFYSKLYEIFDLHVPLKKCTTRHYPVWFNSEIITKIRKKSNVFKKYKRTGLPSYFLEFKNLRRDVKREIDVAFRDYILKVQENLVGDPKKFWSFVNNRKGRSRIPSRMSNGGHSLNSFSEIVNSFATHFKNSYDTADAPANLIDVLGNATFHLYTVSDADILESIGLLKSGLYSGDDGIPAFLIKDCTFLLLPPLRVLFNLILKSGEYPIMWKFGRVCPIFKSGDRSLINNYRPVPILSNFPNLFESVLYRFIYSNVKCHISESQHGFVSSRSTITNLVCITDYIANALDNNTQVDVIYTDFSKAFDKLSTTSFLVN
jgi:hypothetical protein